MIKELHAGDTQISASGWNEMRAAVQGITPGLQQYNSSQRNPVYITVKNVTGSDLPAFSVVRLSGTTYSRTGDTFINQAIAHGVELDGDTPTSAADPIAVIQANCPAGDFVKAIVSGATPVRVTADLNNFSSYSPCVYAKTTPNSYTLSVTYDVTPVRIVSPGGSLSSGENCVYAIIDNNDDRQRFIIHCTGSNGLASFAKNGALFYIQHGSSGWKHIASRPTERVLAVCQEDVPDGFEGYYSMPFYTPEQNYGVKPNMGTPYQADALVQHRGVIDGEYEFSTKRLDYVYKHGRYSYCPTFTFTGKAVSYNGGVGIVIEGHTYPVTFLTDVTPGAGYSLTSYPDVYAGDIITVLVTDGGSSAYSSNVTAIEYPTDFAKGSSIVVEDTMLLGRGWDEDYIPDTNFKYAIKIQGNALI